MNRAVAISLYILIAESISFGLVYLNFTIPICDLSANQESALQGICMFTGMAFIMIALMYINSRYKSAPRLKQILVIMPFALFFFSFAPLFMTASGRSGVYAQQRWAFNSRVDRKYLSENHSEESLVIGGKKYEGFPTKLWDIVNVGDLIQKTACSKTITLDGRHYKFPREIPLKNALLQAYHKIIGR